LFAPRDKPNRVGAFINNFLEKKMEKVQDSSESKGMTVGDAAAYFVYPGLIYFESAAGRALDAGRVKIQEPPPSSSSDSIPFGLLTLVCLETIGGGLGFLASSSVNLPVDPATKAVLLTGVGLVAFPYVVANGGMGVIGLGIDAYTAFNVAADKITETKAFRKASRKVKTFLNKPLPKLRR
jgi:hypothetical protein